MVGTMAKIDDSVKKKVPELRFKGFTDDWEERKLSDIVSRLSKSSNNSELPRVEFEDIVSGEGRLNKDVSHKFDDRKGILFSSQNILYGKLRPYLKNWLLADFKGIALGDFWVFKPINSDPKFVYSLIQSNHYQKVANDTSGTKMPRSDWKKVSSTEFQIPSSLEEQKKIGSFFKKLDDTIALHQRKLDLLKEQKKGYLQKMFPKNGAKVPELRFAGFADDWEERKLIEVADYRNGKAHEKDISEAGDYIVVNSKFVSTNGLVKKYSDEMIAPLSKNEIAFVLSDVPNGRAIARTFLISEENKYSLNQRIAGITPHADTNSYFLHSLMNRNHYFLRFDDGVSQTNLSKREVEKWVELYPSYGEQQKIGSFFKQLDDTITLHQRKLDLLKEQKKGFLQKMFV
ncbi:restriction endonuclease subunit S [Lactococcus cremoris]|uniref:restriction endonuclease subunit S n=1 Tax=Lactococcus lactis subsp. cremoris TaxID=1359 RepID=UPI00223BA938